MSQTYVYKFMNNAGFISFPYLLLFSSPLHFHHSMPLSHSTTNQFHIHTFQNINLITLSYSSSKTADLQLTFFITFTNISITCQKSKYLLYRFLLNIKLHSLPKPLISFQSQFCQIVSQAPNSCCIHFLVSESNKRILPIVRYICGLYNMRQVVQLLHKQTTFMF